VETAPLPLQRNNHAQTVSIQSESTISSISTGPLCGSRSTQGAGEPLTLRQQLDTYDVAIRHALHGMAGQDRKANESR